MVPPMRPVHLLASCLLLAACGDDPVAAPAQPLPAPAQLDALASDPAVLARGRQLYLTGKGYCTTCHGVDGNGGPQGARLASGQWLHGGSMAEVVRSISEGYPQKGMRPWKDSFSQDELIALAAFVRTLPASAASAK
jgi:mono/diheme cytochrome c family protein